MSYIVTTLECRQNVCLFASMALNHEFIILFLAQVILK